MGSKVLFGETLPPARLMCNLVLTDTGRERLMPSILLCFHIGTLVLVCRRISTQCGVSQEPKVVDFKAVQDFSRMAKFFGKFSFTLFFTELKQCRLGSWCSLDRLGVDAAGCKYPKGNL